MNAQPSSLHGVRIRVMPNRVVQLRNKGFLEFCAAIRDIHETLQGMFSSNGWMFVTHPERGLVGLPLLGEKNSWQSAWENENIQIEVYLQSGWKQIEDWSEMEHVSAAH